MVFKSQGKLIHINPPPRIIVLVSALYQLHSTAISVYHFSIVTDLAWACANTHLLSLLVLRHRFSDDLSLALRTARRRKRASLLIRLVMIAALAGILLYAWWVSGYRYWFDSFGCPAACVRALDRGGESLDWAVVFFVLVLRSYPVALIGTSTTVRAVWLSRVRHRLIDHRACEAVGGGTTGCSGGGGKGGGDSVVSRAWSACRRCVLLPVWYFFSSETENVLEQIGWFIITVYWTAVDRAHGHTVLDEEQIEHENEWGFGQIVPLVLLLIPFLEFIESIESTQEGKQDYQGQPLKGRATALDAYQDRV